MLIFAVYIVCAAGEDKTSGGPANYVRYMLWAVCKMLFNVTLFTRHYRVKILVIKIAHQLTIKMLTYVQGID